MNKEKPIDDNHGLPLVNQKKFKIKKMDNENPASEVVNPESPISPESPEQPLKKRGRRSKKEMEAEKLQINEDAIKGQADFLVNVMQSSRALIGIIKPIEKEHRELFKDSYLQCVKTYGDVLGKHMPLMMLCGSLGFICYDSFIELRMIKIKQNEEKLKLEQAEKAKMNNEVVTPLGVEN